MAKVLWSPYHIKGFLDGSASKGSPAMQSHGQETWEMWFWSLGLEDPPGKANGNPLQYSYLESSMHRGAWQATVPRVAQNRTWPKWFSTHAVTICSDFKAQENKICHSFHFPASICYEVMGLDSMILVFWMLNFKPPFSFSLTSSRDS